MQRAAPSRAPGVGAGPVCASRAVQRALRAKPGHAGAQLGHVGWPPGGGGGGGGWAGAPPGGAAHAGGGGRRPRRGGARRERPRAGDGRAGDARD
eukprot:CAMPEP_0118928616 /NCGR_PEP_ID=MMETSP1169-20130426/5838_1 /TAXON_ID=36882 /ORGANISM="Pyramimonas obovata, Strain CCMP722" /LENGTH=94 /DNA_ID=CAMNT_0006870643 /DNA_START=256 /DNA_END=537 /DNA_ORIENTATION=-